MVKNVGEKALAGLQDFEKSGVVLNGNLMRTCFEGLVDHGDQHEVFERAARMSDKKTAAVLKDICGELKTARYWTWVIMHPELTTEFVHVSKRVLPLFMLCSMLSFLCIYSKQSR